MGVTFHLIFMTCIALLLFPQIQALVKCYIYSPSSQSTGEDLTNNCVKYVPLQ